jgi:hypothetical protein
VPPAPSLASLLIITSAPPPSPPPPPPPSVPRPLSAAPWPPLMAHFILRGFCRMRLRASCSFIRIITSGSLVILLNSSLVALDRLF